MRFAVIISNGKVCLSEVNPNPKNRREIPLGPSAVSELNSIVSKYFGGLLYPTDLILENPQISSDGSITYEKIYPYLYCERQSVIYNDIFTGGKVVRTTTVSTDSDFVRMYVNGYSTLLQLTKFGEFRIVFKDNSYKFNDYKEFLIGLQAVAARCKGKLPFSHFTWSDEKGFLPQLDAKKSQVYMHLFKNIVDIFEKSRESGEPLRKISGYYSDPIIQEIYSKLKF